MVGAKGEDSGDSIVSYSAGPTSTDGAAISNLGGGQFSYDPTGAAFFETLTNGSSVTDTFSYTVTDNHGVTASQTATVTVSVTDSGPVVGSASASTNEDAATSITVVGAKGEDSGDSIVSYSAGPTSTDGAAISNLGGGQFSYDPTGAAFFETLTNGSSVTDTFSYTVTDNHGVTASQTATVTVSVTDSGPVVGSASASTNEDAATSITVVGAKGEDSGDSIVSYSAGPTSTDGAAISNLGGGQFSYDPTGAAWASRR